MEYLKIEYNIKGISQEAIVQYENILLPLENEYFLKFLNKYPDTDISKINVVLTDNIWGAIQNFYIENGYHQTELKPKGLDHLVKIVSIHDKKKIFWSAKYTGKFGIKAFFQVLIHNLIEEQIEKSLNINKEFKFNTSVRTITDQLLNIWLLHLVAKKETSAIVSFDEILLDEMSDLTFAFKKNVKDLHYQFQKHKDNYIFLLNVIIEFEIFIRRIIDYKKENNLTGFDEFDNEINEIINLLGILNYSFSNRNDSIYQKNNKLVISLLKKCDIEIYDSRAKENIGFKITFGPKKLFPDLIDTHPRIICFIDILGFKSLIQEYENDSTSLLLKKLKEVFDASRKAAFELLPNTLQSEVREHLEFKMFSDCIIVSIPYIEFGVDIKNGFFNLCIILNVLQQTFMKAGFYLRGHITLGSYFADENMLFSGGLVEAYTNESKTTFPAISVNSKIITKLTETTEFDDSLASMKTLIVKHYLLIENNYILNPFFTHDSFSTLPSEFDKILDGSLKGFGIELKELYIKLFKEQGVNLEDELRKDMECIKDKLYENYRNYLNIYENLEYSHNERIIASSVLEKYRFLYDFIQWREDLKDERFEYFLSE